MEIQVNKNIIKLIKKILMWMTIIAISIELIFFPSLENLAGCMMIVIVYLLFTTFFLKREIIINAPFSFFMFLSMFSYRYLSIIGTLLECKPISYGMEMPIKTFFLETILFIVSSLAFYFSLKKVNRINILQKSLNTLGFYRSGNEKIFWILGLLGCISSILSLGRGKLETGDIIGKLFQVLYYYIYAPVIVFFPCLYKCNTKKSINLNNKKVWIYLIFISILNLGSNSRSKIITPFAITLLLLLLVLCIENTNIHTILKPSNIVKGIIMTIVCTSIISTISKSMLLNRGIREEVSFTQLITNTVETFTSESLDKQWNDYRSKVNSNTSYEYGWTEDYIDNFLFNRFCNIRITDETLYLGEKLSDYGNSMMLENFKNRIIANIPQPIIEMIGLDFNKEDYYNSRGDSLYFYSGVGEYSSLGGYRVTSHLGDGLATFGIFYFVIQFIMWYFVMSLLNSFSIKTKKYGRLYSIYGLLNSYSCLLMFGNTNGIIVDVTYCLRGYWQEITIFLVIITVVRCISSIKFIDKGKTYMY